MSVETNWQSLSYANLDCTQLVKTCWIHMLSVPLIIVIVKVRAALQLHLAGMRRPSREIYSKQRGHTALTHFNSTTL